MFFTPAAAAITTLLLTIQHTNATTTSNLDPIDANSAIVFFTSNTLSNGAFTQAQALSACSSAPQGTSFCSGNLKHTLQFDTSTWTTFFANVMADNSTTIRWLFWLTPNANISMDTSFRWVAKDIPTSTKLGSLAAVGTQANAGTEYFFATGSASPGSVTLQNCAGFTSSASYVQVSTSTWFSNTYRSQGVANCDQPLNFICACKLNPAFQNRVPNTYCSVPSGVSPILKSVSSSGGTPTPEFVSPGTTTDKCRYDGTSTSAVSYLYSPSTFGSYVFSMKPSSSKFTINVRDCTGLVVACNITAAVALSSNLSYVVTLEGKAIDFSNNAISLQIIQVPLVTKLIYPSAVMSSDTFTFQEAVQQCKLAPMFNSTCDVNMMTPFPLVAFSISTYDSVLQEAKDFIMAANVSIGGSIRWYRSTDHPDLNQASSFALVDSTGEYTFDTSNPQLTVSQIFYDPTLYFYTMACYQLQTYVGAAGGQSVEDIIGFGNSPIVPEQRSCGVGSNQALPVLCMCAAQPTISSFNFIAIDNACHRLVVDKIVSPPNFGGPIPNVGSVDVTVDTSITNTNRFPCNPGSDMIVGFPWNFSLIPNGETGSVTLTLLNYTTTSIPVVNLIPCSASPAAAPTTVLTTFNPTTVSGISGCFDLSKSMVLAKSQDFAIVVDSKAINDVGIVSFRVQWQQLFTIPNCVTLSYTNENQNIPSTISQVIITFPDLNARSNTVVIFHPYMYSNATAQVAITGYADFALYATITIQGETGLNIVLSQSSYSTSGGITIASVNGLLSATALCTGFLDSSWLIPPCIFLVSGCHGVVPGVEASLCQEVGIQLDIYLPPLLLNQTPIALSATSHQMNPNTTLLFAVGNPAPTAPPAAPYQVNITAVLGCIPLFWCIVACMFACGTAENDDNDEKFSKRVFGFAFFPVACIPLLCFSAYNVVAEHRREVQAEKARQEQNIIAQQQREADRRRELREQEEKKRKAQKEKEEEARKAQKKKEENDKRLEEERVQSVKNRLAVELPSNPVEIKAGELKNLKVEWLNIRARYDASVYESNEKFRRSTLSDDEEKVCAISWRWEWPKEERDLCDAGCYKILTMAQDTGYRFCWLDRSCLPQLKVDMAKVLAASTVYDTCHVIVASLSPDFDKEFTYCDRLWTSSELYRSLIVNPLGNGLESICPQIVSIAKFAKLFQHIIGILKVGGLNIDKATFTDKNKRNPISLKEINDIFKSFQGPGLPENFDFQAPENSKHPLNGIALIDFKHFHKEYRVGLARSIEQLKCTDSKDRPVVAQLLLGDERLVKLAKAVLTLEPTSQLPIFLITLENSSTLTVAQSDQLKHDLGRLGPVTLVGVVKVKEEVVQQKIPALVLRSLDVDFMMAGSTAGSKEGILQLLGQNSYYPTQKHLTTGDFQGCRVIINPTYRGYEVKMGDATTFCNAFSQAALHVLSHAVFAL